MRSSKRAVTWVTAARKDFSKFPDAVQSEALSALTLTAEGQFPDGVKPLRGFDETVHEIRLRDRGEAYRVIYVLGLGKDVLVVHAFQKKSTQGVKTPQREIDLIHERVKRLKEALREEAKRRP